MCSVSSRGKKQGSHPTFGECWVRAGKLLTLDLGLVHAHASLGNGTKASDVIPLLYLLSSLPGR